MLLLYTLSMLQAAVLSALSALCEEFYQAEPGQANIEMQGESSFIPLFDGLLLECNPCVFIHKHTQT